MSSGLGVGVSAMRGGGCVSSARYGDICLAGRVCERSRGAGFFPIFFNDY